MPATCPVRCGMTALDSTPKRLASATMASGYWAFGSASLPSAACSASRPLPERAQSCASRSRSQPDSRVIFQLQLGHSRIDAWSRRSKGRGILAIAGEAATKGGHQVPTLLIADDDAGFRSSIRRVLQRDPDTEVI